MKKTIQLPKTIKPLLLWCYGIGALTLVSTSILLIFAQPEVPIFYSLALPEQQLAPKMWLLVFPVLSLTLSFAHTLIVSALRKYDELLLKLFVWMTLVLQVLLLLAVVRILFITL